MDQTEILWDKYKGLADAYPGASYVANQATGSAIPQVIPLKQTWNSPIANTAPADLGSAIAITNGSYQQSAAYPWIRKYTVTMGAIQLAGISYWYASTNINLPESTNVCRDSISFSFDPLGSYNVQVFANGIPISPNYAPYPWNYDGDAGILTFYPANLAVLPPTPITMTYWRYVGNKGGNSLAYWTLSDQSPGSNLYFTPLTGVGATLSSNGVFTVPNCQTVASTAQTVNVTLGAGSGNYDILITNTPGLLNNQMSYNSGIYYTPSTSTLHSSIFAGSLTGSASLIDTTLQTSGVQYLTFVPSSASAPAGQVLGTHAAISYDVASSALTCPSFNGDLTGTANAALTTQTYITSTNFPYNLSLMYYDTATTQATYLDTGGNITYNPSTQTLNANYITSRQLPILWNNDFLIAGYTATYPSNATLNTYYLLSQLPATGDSGNGVTQLFSGVIGGWGGDANCQITFKSRGGMVASGTIISDIITTSALIGIVDLIVYTNGGLFQVYLVVKPNVYYTFNFTMTGLNRDVNNILYQPSIGTTTTPTGTISIASVITAITFTNTGGALSAVSLNTTGAVTGSSFTGAGTGLTGTASALVAGSANAALVTASASASATPLLFGAANASASLSNSANITFTPSTNALIVTSGTISCPTITGSTALIGGTVAGTTGRFTGNISQGTTTGYASAGLSVLNNTLTSGQYNNIELGYDSTTANNSWFIGARYNAGSASTILSLAPFGLPQTNCWYVNGSGATTQAADLTLTAGNINLALGGKIIPTATYTNSSSDGTCLGASALNGVATQVTMTYLGGSLYSSVSGTLTATQCFGTFFGATYTGNYRLKLFFRSVASTINQTFNMNFCTAAGVAAPANWANNVSQAANGGVASYYGSGQANIPQIGHSINTAIGLPIWEFDFYQPNGGGSATNWAGTGGTKLVKGCNGSQDSSYYYTTNVNSIYNSTTPYPGIIINGGTTAAFSIYIEIWSF